MGITHLIIDLWGVYIVVLGYRRLLQISLWFAVLLSIVWISAGLPLAVIFVRAPV